MKDNDDIKYRPIVIRKATIDTFLRQEDPFGLIALYTFYYYTAVWQKTNTPYAKTCFVAEGLKVSEKKIRKLRKVLLDLGYIQDIVVKDDKGKMKSRYVKVRYYAKKSTLTKIHTVENPPGGQIPTNAYRDNSKNAYSSNSRQEIGDSKTTPSPFDGKASERLYKIIKSHINININTSKWPDIFRRLRTVDKISKARIKDVLNWYKSNIGDKYTPVAHSAVSFREKFTRLESAMFRYNKKHYGSDDEDDDGGEPVLTYRMGGDGEMGYYDDN